MIKIMLRSNYDDMVNYQVEILKENAELRKVIEELKRSSATEAQTEVDICKKYGNR